MTAGKSTGMPSITLSLPKHVNAKPRKDGTFNVLFEVRRNRPSDWPSTIPLPITGRRTGDLSNADEVARIIADVEGTAEREHQDGLLWKLEQARNGDIEQGLQYPSDSLPAIAALWEASWSPSDGRPPPIKPRTQEFYRKGLSILNAWAWLPKNRARPMRQLELPTILAFLSLYDDRPAQQGALRRTLSALFSFAMAGGHGGVKTHPFGVTPRLRRRTRRLRPVELWDRSDVANHAKVAAETPLSFEDGEKVWDAGGRLVELMWETSADQTDVVTWRRDIHLRDAAQPAIVYTRGKTGEQVVCPISKGLAAKLKACGSLFFVTDPDGRPYAADDVRADNRRGGHFRKLQEAVIAKGGRRRVLDHLRHSAITDAVEKGAPIGSVPSVSGHRGPQMVEQIYLQLTERQALAVQRARGIVDD